MLTKLTIATAVLLVASAPSAVADDWWGEVSCSTGQPGCELAAGANVGIAPAHRPPATGGTTPLGGAMTESAPPCIPSIPPGLTNPADQEAWHAFACGSPGSASASFGAQGVAVAPSDLASVARARLRLPAPGVASSPGGAQLVHLPTWLWLASGWEPVSATASVPGVTVTAVARPESATWSLGDGTTVTCMGPGTPYPSSGDPARPSPDCGHTYQRASASQPGRVYSVTASVRWSVSWTGAGESGSFPGMTTTATTSFQVLESQAVTTG